MDRKSEREKIMRKFNLKPHPEGGFYNEFYRSEDTFIAKPQNYGANESRNLTSSIYFLIDSESHISWHILKSDEVWNFFCGSQVTIFILNESFNVEKRVLGHPLEDHVEASVLIPRNHYFTASVNEPDSYAFINCTVSPGFDFKDYKLIDSDELVKQFEIVRKHSLKK